MARLTRSDRFISYVEARWVECLAGLYLLFILQSTVVPFDFDLNRSDLSASSLYVITTGWSYWPDIVANIFLYLPFGVLLHWSWVRSLRRLLVAVSPAVLIALIVSLGTEWIQAYSPSRVSSLVDVAANAVGATLGVCVSIAGGWSGPRFKQFLRSDFRLHPGECLLKVYCLLLVLFALVPFGILLDGPRLRQAFRESTLIPFEQSIAHQRKAQDARDRDDEHMHAVERFNQMNLWTRWAAEFASFVVLVWLLNPVLFRDYQFSRTTTNALTWWIAGGLALGLSVLQLPVLSRGFHVTDILMRLTGAAVGIFTRWWFIERMEVAAVGAPSAQDRLWFRFAKFGCGATFIYIMIGGLIPFIVDTRERLLSRAILTENFLPFFSYFRARFDLAMGDLIGKAASYVVFAALLAHCWGGLHYRPVAIRLRAVTLVVLGMSVVIEIAQVALRPRVPSLTDPIIAVVAGACGVILQDKLARFFREAVGPDAGQVPAVAAERGPTLTITDEIIAGLVEPRDDAPQEQPVKKPAPTQDF